MNGKILRIVYMGTPEFAVTPLRKLVECGYNVVAVITMPDKPAGRGLKVQESAVKKYAIGVGLPVLQPEKLKDPEFIEQFKALNADLGIVIAFRMLPEIVWAMPKLGTFNLHASLLPQYRGAAPINWAIINGETETGVTTFMLNHEIDKGDILCRSEVTIEEEDNIGTLHDKLMYEGEKLVVETVEKIAAGEVKPLPQHQIESVELKLAPKIFKEDCLVDWSRSCMTVKNLIRGLSPYPGAWSVLKKHNEHDSCMTEIPVKIYAAHIENLSHNYPIGKLFSDGKKYIKVACSDGYIFIDELQPAGKKRMSTEEWLRGFKGIEEYTFSC